MITVAAFVSVSVLIILRAFFGGTTCPDCGWLFACDECSKRYDDIDQELRRKK